MTAMQRQFHLAAEQIVNAAVDRVNTTGTWMERQDGTPEYRDWMAGYLAALNDVREAAKT